MVPGTAGVYGCIWCIYIYIYWLVVSTILKNMSQWEGLHPMINPIYEMENKIHVPNHQPIYIYMYVYMYYIHMVKWYFQQSWGSVANKRWISVEWQSPKVSHGIPQGWLHMSILVGDHHHSSYFFCKTAEPTISSHITHSWDLAEIWWLYGWCMSSIIVDQQKGVVLNPLYHVDANWWL